MRPGCGEKTREKSEMRRKMRLHSKVAGKFLSEWQEEPCGIKNGRVRACIEIGDLMRPIMRKILRGEGLKAIRTS